MADTTPSPVTRRSFRAFLWAQALSAFNDNAFRFVMSAAAVGAAGAEAAGEISWMAVVFSAPFLLLSGYAGQVADAVEKRRVIVAAKAAEVVVLGLAAVALQRGHTAALAGVLALLGVQATFFSPAKYGIVPELVDDAQLSRGNGALQLTTFLAILLGGAAGPLLHGAWHEAPWRIGVLLVAVALAGLGASLAIGPVERPSPGARISLNPVAGLGRGARRLIGDRTLLQTGLGIAYFWGLGALVQLAIVLVGRTTLGLGDSRVAALGAVLAVGIGVGSVLAGRVSGAKVELGLAPIGGFGMGASLLALAGSSSFGGAAFALAMLGLSGGFFIVPLYALVQQRPVRQERGQVLATVNLLATAAVLAGSGALWLFAERLAWTPGRILAAAGLATLAASLYVLWLVPEFFVRLVLWTLTHSVYRIRIDGLAHVPRRGPALLVCNHLSHVDGLIVGASLQRFVRFMVYRPIYEMPLLNPLLRFMHAIPVSPQRADVKASLARARAELEAGHVVCIFAEGAISRTGNILPFRRGFERIVEGLDVPVIPVNLDRLWGSIFSFKQGRFFWKWPERIPFPVTVSFGAPMPSSSTAGEVRHAVMMLASDAMIHRVARHEVLHQRFFRTARRHWGQLAMADATRTLTFGRALVAALLLSRWIRRHGGTRRMLGIMLPASIGGALANIAVLVAGRVPVNLNFTAGRESIASAIAQCGIDTVLTSKQFLSKAKLDEQPGMVFLEDVMPTFGTGAKLATLVTAALSPAWLLDRLYAPEPDDADALATVIFSSGSTGAPKGVMLSHRNVLSNLEAMAQLYWITEKDRIIGVLPFFHSFGFTGTLWFPLVGGFAALYVPNPMDAKAVGELAGTYGASMMIGTPTFYQAYIRRCTPEQFAKLRYAIVGAEKLREPIARAFQEKYGLEIIEGYGCTEMAPVVSCNMPAAPEGQVTSKFGTVGHPLPGVVARVVHPDTGAPLDANEPGLLLVKGPNLMLGYLDNPSKTAEAVKDGWYVTGDIGTIDEDGFIRLTDRLSRFAKIAGEMVPFGRIEEAASAILDDPNCVVAAVEDADRGERLVLMYVKPDVSPADLWARLNDSDLPKLWVPKRESIYRIEAVPVLGTGKVDLRAVKQLAESLVAVA
jgi:acyl-[acyl-carrier-protein]-phospholipid O-acyltransferase/long-chain-fatty-acid--[acyl-carrier-protein] ligase